MDSAKAKFIFDNIRFGDSGVVRFTNQSIVALFSSKCNRWTFGDGDTDTVASPQHLYNITVSYTVKFVGTSKYDCIDFFIVANAVKYLPVRPLPLMALIQFALSPIQDCSTQAPL